MALPEARDTSHKNQGPSSDVGSNMGNDAGDDEEEGSGDDSSGDGSDKGSDGGLGEGSDEEWDAGYRGENAGESLPEPTAHSDAGTVEIESDMEVNASQGTSVPEVGMSSHIPQTQNSTLIGMHRSQSAMRNGAKGM